MTIIGAQPRQFNEGNTDLVASSTEPARNAGNWVSATLAPALMLSPTAHPRRFCPKFADRGLAQVRQGSRSAQRFRVSLTDLADEKVSFFDAAILIFSPFADCGLRVPASP
jgi:hypothetical protein